MRSVILDKHKTNECGICGAGDLYIEKIEKDGIPFIWCQKCHTISFFEPVEQKKKEQIEKEMNVYQNK